MLVDAVEQGSLSPAQVTVATVTSEGVDDVGGLEAGNPVLERPGVDAGSGHQQLQLGGGM